MEQAADSSPEVGADRDPAPAGGRLRRSRILALTGMVIVGVLLVTALWAGFSALYRSYWGPSAFVERYLALLADDRAADALALPGVGVDSVELEERGLPLHVSDALLRPSALASLEDFSAIGQSTADGVTSVEVTYLADGHRGHTTFEVTRDGWRGLTPAWRFATSPLAIIDVTVRGAMDFIVNGFEMDKRQVSVDQAQADPLESVPMLVFTPGLYDLDVDTPTAVSDGVSVLADAPLQRVPVDIQSNPTEEFVQVVQKRVNEFLDSCVTQQVLKPTGCPFGLTVQDRVAGVPTWSIVEYPEIEVVPAGSQWAIPATEAIVHLDVGAISIYDGTRYRISTDVPFTLDGTINILPSGVATIGIDSPDAR